MEKTTFGLALAAALSFAPISAEAEELRGPHLASLAFELGVTIELVTAYQQLLLQGAVPVAG